MTTTRKNLGAGLAIEGEKVFADGYSLRAFRSYPSTHQGTRMTMETAERASERK